MHFESSIISLISCLQTVIRGNAILEVNDLADPLSIGISLVECESAVTEQNVIDTAVGTLILQSQSGPLEHFDNATPAGVVQQGCDQQVYAASEFAYLTNFGGGWAIDILFRGDATNGTQLGIYMPIVQVNLSMTQRGPGELSPVFSENVGFDNTVVFSGQLNTGLIGGHRQGPEVWDFEIPLSKLFFYNPMAGNLLLDVRVFQGNTNTNGMIPIVFDAVNFTNDSVARVWWGDVNASTGLVETIGLPTELFFWPNPKLNIQADSNSVGLWWPVNPTSFVFQTTQDLNPQTQWQSVTNGIVTSNLTNTYTIPLNSAGATANFRLISTTPP